MAVHLDARFCRRRRAHRIFSDTMTRWALSLIFLGISSIITYAVADPPTKIERVHLGSIACQFQLKDGNWYGIKPDTLPKLMQCLGIENVWQNHGAIDVSASLTGGVVPCNIDVCGTSTVPEITNILLE